MENSPSKTSALSIVVIGASGDLAVKKIFPALFALYCRKLLPETFTCHGFARSPLSDEQFRNLLQEHLTCRYTPGETACRQYMEVFLDRCFYNVGQYDSIEDYQHLKVAMETHEPSDRQVTRLFYFSIPPFCSGKCQIAARRKNQRRPVRKKQLQNCGGKPFGRDRSSSDALTGTGRGLYGTTNLSH